MPFVTSHKLEDMLYPPAVTVAGRAMAEKGGKRLHEVTQARTPIDTSDVGPLKRARVPGTLRESIQVDRVRAKRGVPKGWQVRVFTEDPIAPHVEWTTKPHEIRPRDPRGSLRFYSHGQVRFAKVVHHPGTRGQKMFSGAAAFVQSEVGTQFFREELDRFAHDVTTQVRLVRDLLP